MVFKKSCQIVRRRLAVMVAGQIRRWLDSRLLVHACVRIMP